MNTFLRTSYWPTYNRLNPTYSTSPNYLVKPKYRDDLEKYPTNNPLFIAIDWGCLNFFKQYRGICLFFKKSHRFSFYDLSFCYRREIWVIYTLIEDQAIALELGHHIQLAGASTIKIIAFDSTLLGSN
jgi:hypothetical protein